MLFPIFSSSLCLAFVSAQYSATYLPSTAPKTTEEGQTGTNQCGDGSSQTSMCQNAYINSIDDFCLWAPPQAGADSSIGNTEQIEVAWCLKSGYGTRLIPDGAISGAHFVKTPDFVQVTGVGDLTKLNIPANGDGGGELDPHGADGNGNPIGGLVFSTAFGQLEQVHEWTNFMAQDEFCFRACDPKGSNPAGFCQHIYDVMGCLWNMPANYDSGVFEECAADSGEPMGVYGTSTFFQGDPSTPAAHSIPQSSECSSIGTVSSGEVATSAVVSSSVTAPTTASSTSVASSSRVTSSTQSSSGGGSATSSARSSTQSIFSSTSAPSNSGALSVTQGVSSAGNSSPSQTVSSSNNNGAMKNGLAVGLGGIFMGMVHLWI